MNVTLFFHLRTRSRYGHSHSIIPQSVLLADRQVALHRAFAGRGWFGLQVRIGEMPLVVPVLGMAVGLTVVSSHLEYLIVLEPASGANHRQSQTMQRGRLDELTLYIGAQYGLRKVEVLAVTNG